MNRVSCVVIIALFGSGCCNYWQEHPVIISSTGQKLCARHHIPLITVHGYGDLRYAPYPNRVIILEHTWGLQAQKEKCNPNYIPSGQSLHRSKDKPISVLITYCPKCEDARWLNAAEAAHVEEELKRQGIEVERH